jgi:hypothetical protein
VGPGAGRPSPPSRRRAGYQGDKDEAGRAEGLGWWPCTIGGLEGSSRYLGEFKAGKPHGRGRLQLPEGTVAVGCFQEGKQSGPCGITFANGDRVFGDSALRWSEKDGLFWKVRGGNERLVGVPFAG